MLIPAYYVASNISGDSGYRKCIILNSRDSDNLQCNFPGLVEYSYQKSTGITYVGSIIHI